MDTEPTLVAPAVETSAEQPASHNPFSSGFTPPEVPVKPEPETPATPTLPTPEVVPATTPAVTPAQVPPPAGTAQMTPQQIADAVAAGVKTVLPQPAAPEATPLTQEQLDTQFNVIRPTQAHIDKLFQGGPEAVQVMQDLLHGSVRMATTIVAHKLNDVVAGIRAEFSGQLAPARAMAEQQEMQKHEAEFNKRYPELTPFDGILRQTFNTLVSTGFKGTPEEVYTEIAKRAKETITAVNPQAFAPGTAPAAAGAKPAQPTHRMSTSPSGGGSGGAGTSGSGGSKNTAERTFGK